MIGALRDRRANARAQRMSETPRFLFSPHRPTVSFLAHTTSPYSGSIGTETQSASLRFSKTHRTFLSLISCDQGSGCDLPTCKNCTRADHATYTHPSTAYTADTVYTSIQPPGVQKAPALHVPKIATFQKAPFKIGSWLTLHCISKSSTRIQLDTRM